MRPPGKQYFCDRKRKRFVVYRRTRGRHLKTSIRYGAVRTKGRAESMARALGKIWARLVVSS